GPEMPAEQDRGQEDRNEADPDRGEAKQDVEGDPVRVHGLTNAHPRVQVDIADVGDELGQEHHHDPDHGAGQQQLNVVVVGGADQGPAEALVGEERLDDDDAG